ncbi:hypothetical protein B0H14DRAFT_2222109, partial [Mycena olivaceomarginata]
LVVEFIPTTFDPSLDGTIRVLEDNNNLGRGAITTAHFVKPVECRRSGQRTAHVTFGFRDAPTVNRVI